MKIPVTAEGIEYLDELISKLREHNERFDEECGAIASSIDAKESLHQYKEEILQEVDSARSAIQSIKEEIETVISELSRVRGNLEGIISLLG